MISICIPIHNVNVLPLVETLLKQAEEGRIDVEVILFDDRSIDSVRSENEKLRDLKKVIYLPLIENIGRSRIRNRMADMAIGEWLLFLDCDMYVMNDDFLATYAQYTNRSDDVVCGGIFYGARPNDKDVLLQWRTEQQQMRHRMRISKRGLYEYVSTGNFMIRRAVFDPVRFDEKITSYGQEDQVFSLELDQKKIKILRIQNPTLHTGHESNEPFLQKIENSLFNLVQIWNADPHFHDKLYKASKRLQTAILCQRFRIAPFLRLLFRIFGKRQRKACVGGEVASWRFAAYQLGFLLAVFHIPNLASSRNTFSPKKIKY